MHRILILDSDQPLREQLTVALSRAANTEVVVASDETELMLNVKYGRYAAVFADADLLDGDPSSVVEAVRSAVVRPMLIVASNERAEDLDPDLVTLVVRKPYDVQTVTGILLSAVIDAPPAAAHDGDSPAAN
jgi:DNA-binding response OmpR family regulator